MSETAAANATRTPDDELAALTTLAAQVLERVLLHAAQPGVLAPMPGADTCRALAEARRTYVELARLRQRETNHSGRGETNHQPPAPPPPQPPAASTPAPVQSESPQSPEPEPTQSHQSSPPHPSPPSPQSHSSHAPAALTPVRIPPPFAPCARAPADNASPPTPFDST